MNDHQKEALFTTLARRFDIVLDGMLPHAVSEDHSTVALVGSLVSAGTTGVYIITQLPDIGSGISVYTWTFQQRLCGNVSVEMKELVYNVEISKDNSTIFVENIYGKKFKFVKSEESFYKEVPLVFDTKPITQTKPMNELPKGPDMIVKTLESQIRMMEDQLTLMKYTLSVLKEQLTT